MCQARGCWHPQAQPHNPVAFSGPSPTLALPGMVSDETLSTSGRYGAEPWGRQSRQDVAQPLGCTVELGSGYGSPGHPRVSTPNLQMRKLQV